MRRCVGDSNVYRATSPVAGQHTATSASGLTRHVINATTSLPVDRLDDIDSMSGRPDDDDDDDDDDVDDDDYHYEMTSFGSGYYDNDDADDGDYRDAASMKPRHRGWSPESPLSSSSSSSSHSRPVFHVDDSDHRSDDGHLDDRRRDDNHRPSDKHHLKDVSRTPSTTQRARTMLRDPSAVSPTRRGYVERRRPAGSPTSSSSAAARRRHYAADNSATSSASASLITSLYTFSSFLHCVAAAAILFSSAHVFLPLPVIRSTVC